MTRYIRRSSLLGAIALLVISSSLWIGCGSDSDTIVGPTNNTTDTNVVMGGELHLQLRPVFDIQDVHTPSLMEQENVVGVGTTIDELGNPAIVIYTENEVAKRNMFPMDLDGVPVIVETIGRVVAMKGGPGGGGGGGGSTSDPKAVQTPPVKMGTSGGWRYDLANGYCCGGTLGSLIRIGSTQYVLSNYHVLYSDTVNGGNGRVASAGDPVIQPGLIDIGCQAANGQNVATLVNNGGTLPGANIDAGIAATINGMVDTSGAILNVGTISSSIVGASVNQAVKKMGRTTGLTRSKVSSLNATISVAYDNECAGGADFTKTFTGQIVIANKGSKFLAGGDSGSLMIEDVDSNARAVGLLYAGSSFSAIANPISHVLNHFNASMVGN